MKRFCFNVALALAAALLLPAPGRASEPGASAFRPAVLAEVDREIESAIAEKKLPGGVLWIEHAGQIHTKAYGSRTLLPEPQPATLDTVYDAASLTKVVATTPAIMILVERGQLRLDDPVAKYLPEFTGEGREKITVRHLLTHTSGLFPIIRKTAEYNDVPGALRHICAEKPLATPGTTLRYSDLNFILLGEIVRAATSKRLDAFAREEIFVPLGMTDTGFLPPTAHRDRVAPTTKEKTGLIRGTVHDPAARKMGGVAGHAGLFTTARDLARFGRMLLNGGILDDARILKPETVALMTRVHTPESVTSRRALGWDIDHLSSSLRGAHLTKSSYGHTGWTGGALLLSPATDTVLVFLSNRNHPRGGNVVDLRKTIGTLVAEAFAARNFARVKNGIDVLVANDFQQLDGLTVGLVTNHTGRARDGRTTIDLLHTARNVKLTALFSPEHGIRGAVEGSVTDETDAKTGLPIHSLYRSKTRKPSAAQLAGLDALVFDIQDIGCRFYTYISTMGNAMEAAAENDLRFIVLDRVNPINGRTVEGPVRKGESSFTAYHDIPVRHGMTVGELAKMFRTEKNLDVALTVVPLENWSRAQYFDETALKWVNPSPNMRSLEEAILYPGIGLLEFMNLSVGRGTDTPFEHIGAPYIDAGTLHARLQAEALPGIRIIPTRFTPDASVFQGKLCHGVAFEITDRDQFRSVRTGIAVARALHHLHPGEIKYERFRKLLVHPPTFDAVKGGWTLDEIERIWYTDLEEFRKRREQFLLY